MDVHEYARFLTSLFRHVAHTPPGTEHAIFRSDDEIVRAGARPYGLPEDADEVRLRVATLPPYHPVLTRRMLPW